MKSSTAYGGPQRKLVLAFDLGTTYSGISYSILDPGQVPKIKPVTRFPAQGHIAGVYKIPTIIYYDRKGTVRAVGAEAKDERVFEKAEEEHWVKAEWFILHLRSKTGNENQILDHIPPLPLNKTVTEVTADFLVYLLQCAASYIQDTNRDGSSLWASIRNEVHFVLSHPNGWEGRQQAEMRKAAVLAKLVPETPSGHSRISFVTEGEAKLHFLIYNGLPDSAIKHGDGVVIVDTGSGTIDVSSYSKIGSSREIYEEIAAPECYMQGSASVKMYAEAFLRSYLEGSSYGNAKDIQHIVECFDKLTTKPQFRDPSKTQYVKFGGLRDKDLGYNIRNGQLKLQGADVVTFFEPSINCIVEAVQEQRRKAHKPISHVILVGGFTANDWVFNKVHEALAPLQLNVMRPDNYVGKAVSDGAISFYLDHYVNTRVSKVTYGNFCHIPFDANDPEHIQRASNTFTSISGNRRIKNSFDVILAKNTQVSETQEFRRSYVREYEKIMDDFKTATFNVWCYRGVVEEPKWKDVDEGHYSKLCTIEVGDLSKLPLLPEYRAGVGGSPAVRYYRLSYDIVLLFGLTELKAFVAWKDQGEEKRSETKILYDIDPTDE
ncbi:hypothetical protein D9613_001112 [Agrocybe pediades]|uniref:Heat shock 70 kDa protein 12A n=1 Tax=Agrocybe pediades TaxID=84607 RepID=A0A8H4R185_9AGAR|nr:hypothetical protein D9613_001112 [Agrocybe pediades]